MRSLEHMSSSLTLHCRSFALGLGPVPFMLTADLVPYYVSFNDNQTRLDVPFLMDLMPRQRPHSRLSPFLSIVRPVSPIIGQEIS